MRIDAPINNLSRAEREGSEDGNFSSHPSRPSCDSRFFHLCLSVVICGFLFFTQGIRAEEEIVHLLIPGFTVRELPLKISNCNNLRFSPDGKLFAFGYDGRVHILSDTNGDGLEDHDELFWDKPTISVPVGMCFGKDGLYISSHGKISVLRDTDGDGKADTEEIIASGWPGTDVGTGGVDATAVTLDAEGNIYFGLLTPDYSNAYRVHDGVSKYSTNGIRGTILKLKRTKEKNPPLPPGEDFRDVKLAPGFQLEIVATGIRVPYTLLFNRAGDLFNTDQEGATWCDNGNPLDEVNQIILGKNYGFPPRHEKWLPNLISEPPVVAFGPQHESTCGLVFNEPKKGRGLFGPKWWEGDAFVAGESRGKIWRVRLVKTPHGYVGKEFLIARLKMLTMDLAISPKGDLYVCCHSGLPDWGTGPQGAGKIFKISYTDTNAPQPVIAWAASSNEVRVAFDQPIDASITNHVGEMKIEFGEFVRAADRYEVLKPPYKVVKDQEATPRGTLKVFTAKLENENQTLVLATAPHTQAVNYALALSGVKTKGKQSTGAAVDLDYDLNGVKADWAKNLPKHSINSIPQIEMVITGDWQRGRELFFGAQKCFTCHRVRGEGATVGPDLSNLVSRDAASVLRDIKEPSASINPDYVAYNVTLNDDRELTGFLRTQNQNSLQLIGADGKETSLQQTEIKEMRASAVSLMPTGLLDNLKEESVRDLLMFLLNEPPKRTREEVEKVFAEGKNRQPLIANRHLKIVLVASKQDHGPGEHDYPTWQKKWNALLAGDKNIAVTNAWECPTPEEFQTANVIAFYFWNHDWSAERLQQLDDFSARGGGIVLLHAAVIADKEPEKLAERAGLSAQPVRTKYIHAPLDLKIVAAAEDPITRGLPRQIRFIDEPYWPMIGDASKVQVLAAANEDGKEHPMIWTFQRGKGRVFASVLGHYTWTHDDPFYRILVLRGLAWTAGEPINRFDDLVLRNFKAEK